MKRIFLILAVMIAAGAAAQPAGPPTTGPGPLPAPSMSPSPSPSRSTAPPAGRNDLWQLLTPEQREQLWRSLTPEQRSDVWRGLEPQERREMRDRLDGGDMRGATSPWATRRRFGDGARTDTMTPEERQQMREQVREAHRLRRERMEAERARAK